MESLVAALGAALALMLAVRLVQRRLAGDRATRPAVIAALALLAAAELQQLAGPLLGWPELAWRLTALAALGLFAGIAALDVRGYAWQGGSARQAAGSGLALLGVLVVTQTGAMLPALSPFFALAAGWLALAAMAVGLGLAGSPLVSDPLPPQALARRRRRSAAVGIGTAMLGVTVLLVSLPVLPWTMGIVGNVKYSYASSLPAENKGTYLVTDDGVMQLYSWYVQPDDVPPDIPVLQGGRVHAVAFVQKQFSDLSAYQLYDTASGALLPWGSATRHGMQMVVQLPSALPPGRYMVSVPLDSMFGGRTWQFFSIE